MAAKRQCTLERFFPDHPPLRGKALVEAELLALLLRVPLDHPMFGPLEHRVLRMPRMESADARVLTWPKYLRRLASEITNAPTSALDCWLVPASKDDGYHESKLSADGSSNKYRTHRLLFALLEPTSYDTVDGRDVSLQAMHRCGRGKGAGDNPVSCINPNHVCLGSSLVNQDMKGCKYGAAFLCPHLPKCIWVSDVGVFLSCRNNPAMRSCACDRVCFP
eukprot:m.225889 g.225889  ORF g.225889 m.225889 type:complete len:220 (+) comp16822_c0_seq1:438-1097(+)